MHSYKGSWGGGEGERGWGDLSIQFETCNKELALKLSQCVSHFSWWALITRWRQKERVCAGPWRGTRAIRAAWGSRLIAVHMSLWTSSKYNEGDISGKVHNISVTNPQKPLWPLHLPNPAEIISFAMHLFLTPLFKAEQCVLVQNVFVAKYRRLIKKECHCCVHCPLTFLMCVSLCMCVCV